MSKKQIIPRIYFVLFAIVVLLILLGTRYARTDVVDVARENESKTLIPEEVRQISEDVREFVFTEENVDETNSGLAFFSKHQNIWVYADGELVYSVTAGKTIFGHTTGSRWNYVDIPHGTTELVVRVEALEKQTRDFEMTFEQGNATQMFASLIRSSVLEVMASMLDVLVGILLVTYWLVVGRRDKNASSILYFGMFAGCIGWWSFLETEMAALLIRNSQWASYATYVMLLSVAVPFVLFVRDFVGVKGDPWVDRYCIVGYIYTAGAIILHMTDRISFKNTISGAHILMGIAIVYLLTAIGRHWSVSGFDRMVKANLCGSVILIIALSMDSFAFYLQLQKTDVVGRIGILIYVSLLGWEVTSSTLQQMDEGRKAAIYKELAMKDVPTGLFNRNAYNQWIDENKIPNETIIVTYDLNNLKQCNDTLGHSAGDQYIASAAGIIQKAFDGAGDTYRIGGDEFCTILQHANEADIWKYLNRLRELEQEFNEKSELVTMHIACGYAVYDADMDKSLEDTRNRADIWMYRNKKELKEA